MNVQIYDFKGNLITVPFFQLLQWKGAINLETKGLRNSRGSVTAHVRRKLSAPPNYSRADLLAYLVECVEDFQEQFNSGDLNLQPVVDPIHNSPVKS